LSKDERVQAYNRRFEQSIEEVNAAKVDLVLIGGDLTNNGLEEQMDWFRTRIKKFTAPVLYVPGNHDIGRAGDGKRKPTITADRLKLYEKKLGAMFFSETRAGVRVVGLSSPLIGSGLKPEETQWKLLEKELAKPRPEPTLVLLHYPLHEKSLSDAPPGFGDSFPAQQKRLCDLVRQGGARAVLSGHVHRRFAHTHEGILFLSNPATAMGRASGPGRPGWLLVSVPNQGEITFEFHGLDE
jgi:3',5'-cyclic AMP phosphodiesterase CpdA